MHVGSGSVFDCIVPKTHGPRPRAGTLTRPSTGQSTHLLFIDALGQQPERIGDQSAAKLEFITFAQARIAQRMGDGGSHFYSIRTYVERHGGHWCDQDGGYSGSVYLSR